MYAYFQWWSNQYWYLKTLLSLKTETEDVRQKLFPSLKVSRMSRLRSLVYTVTSVLDNRSGTSVQVQVHWYVRLKAERITTSAEQILSLIFTEHFFSKFTKFTLLKKCSARIVSSNLFCSVRCSAAAILSPGWWWNNGFNFGVHLDVMFALKAS